MDTIMGRRIATSNVPCPHCQERLLDVIWQDYKNLSDTVGFCPRCHYVMDLNSVCEMALDAKETRAN